MKDQRLLSPVWHRQVETLLASLLAALAVVADSNSGRGLATALDRYVAEPDPNYAWELAAQQSAEGVTISFLKLTSQSWLTTNEVNRTLWRHWLVVYAPAEVVHSTALLFIAGGSNRDDKPPRPSGELGQIALRTKSFVAELRMVPNQPLIFRGDGRERVEDEVIAYTWDRYLRSGDDKWPARLPMTKAAVRGLDTLTAFAATEEGGRHRVDRFVVAGGSKRGWTTWTTAIVDQRVVAICPIVIDMLNVVPSFIHHYRAYGFFAPAVQDYVDAGIMEWMGTSQFARLMDIVEPYEYRARLTLPKLLLNACGDQFFVPDSAQFYLRDLPGETLLRYVPNADHSLKESDAWETLLGWYDTVLNGKPRPKFDWRLTADDRLVVEPQDKPDAARLWFATNTERRDFRLDTLGPVWKSKDLTPDEQGAYSVELVETEPGWTAQMVELTYDLHGPAPLKLTTEVFVRPSTLPFAAPKLSPPTLSE